MSNAFADLTAAPLLFKYGAKTYEVSPLDQSDWGHFARCAQFSNYYAVAALPNMPPERVDDVFNKCLATPVDITSPQCFAFANTVEGGIEFVYLSLRHKQPNIDRQEIAAFSTPTMESLYKLIMAISLTITGNEDAKKKAVETIASMKESNLLA